LFPRSVYFDAKKLSDGNLYRLEVATRAKSESNRVIRKEVISLLTTWPVNICPNQLFIMLSC